MTKRNGTVGYIELVLTSIIWGVTYVLMKYSLSFIDTQQIAFSVFWFGEAGFRTSNNWIFDLWLIPLFIVFGVAVYFFAHRK